MREGRRDYADGRMSPYEVYLRTGHSVIGADCSTVELKFNPNHDPKNGRFTFKGGGNAGARNAQNKQAGAADNRPRPVRLKDGSTVANPHSPTGILMQPPNVSLAKNAAEGASWLGITANAHMINNFQPGGAMDYQRTFGSDGLINRNYIDFGDYNYGVVSAAAGYTLDEAQAAAGVFNHVGRGDKSGIYGGNSRNQAMIAVGWRDYIHGKIGR